MKRKLNHWRFTFPIWEWKPCSGWCASEVRWGFMWYKPSQVPNGYCTACKKIKVRQEATEAIKDKG